MMEIKDCPTWISAVASVVSALGVFFTYWQVRIIRAQAVTQFEDDLDREYRQIISHLPACAILGRPLTTQEYEANKERLLAYIDLSNEQVFYRKCKRITDLTWESWRIGIQTNLTSPAFSEAWREIKNNTPHYEELRRLEKEMFRNDPVTWT